jgi:hypothetical protein
MMYKFNGHFVCTYPANKPLGIRRVDNSKVIAEVNSEESLEILRLYQSFGIRAIITGR